ncbi:MAG: hypothetical protein FD180_767 [Planctomycetota bacterium]|nr:MAG: hypothetical protein FD180_767 [Planctomycetota bacterium]
MSSLRASHLLALALLAGCSSGPRRGIIAPEDVPPGWTLHATAHYQVLSDAGGAETQAIAERLEGVLALYMEILPPTRALPRFPVRMLETYAAYLEFGGKEGTSGWYDQTSGDLVLTLFVGYGEPVEGVVSRTPSGEGWVRLELDGPAEQEVISSAYHEGWHQYFHWYLDREEDPPTWFDEGMADYFGQARPVPSKDAAPTAPDAPGVDMKWGFSRRHPAWLASVQAAVETEKSVPLKEFVHWTREQYYEEPSLTYPEGWALVHFLLNADDKRVREVPAVLVRALKEGAEAGKAVDEAFAGMDWEKLDEEWKRHVRGLR